MLIYAIEDDESIRGLLKIVLEGSGYEVSCFERGEEALGCVERDKPSLLILDIMLPGIGGTEVLRLLRSSENKFLKHLPVIFLTAKDAERDKVLGLDLGADDYITKPFGVSELLARVRAVIRRTEERKQAERELTLGPLTVRTDSREVVVDGELIPLTFKEYEMLVYLLKNKNRVISRDELLSEVWGYDYTGESRTIDIHIKTTRQKLKSAGGLIKTVRGMGYRISGDTK